MKWMDVVGRRTLILDGGLGSELQNRSKGGFDFPERLNLEAFEIIRQVHLDYLEAGADILTTNTLGANRIKLSAFGAENQVEELNRRGVAAAREARGSRTAWIAGSMGCTGRLIDPLGNLSVEEAEDVFAEQAKALASGGADLLLIETQIDILEARTALRASRAVTDLPIAVSMTFPLEDGRTVTGSDPAVAAAALAHADAIGINCGGHPETFEAFIREITAHNPLPLIAYANAGIPRKKDGRIHFPLGPEEYLPYARMFHRMGAAVVGGCCGTTPAHIRLLANELKGLPLQPRSGVRPGFRAASRNSLFLAGGEQPFRVIGENINPFARKPLRAEIKQGRLDLARTYARRQQEAGADALDVNLGKRGEKEPDFYAKSIRELQSVTRLPLILDNGSPDALDAAMRLYAGKAVINSVTGESRSYETLLPLAVRHGAAVILLAMDENGIPERAEDRLRIIEDLRRRAFESGLGPADLLADPVTLALSASPEGPKATLNTIRLLAAAGIPSVIGLSNLSFGLPRRSLLNGVFLDMALEKGLDCAILNPTDADLSLKRAAGDALTGRDPGLRRYVSRFQQDADVSPAGSGEPVSESVPEVLQRAIREGEKAGIESCLRQLLEEGREALDILENILTPALRRAGDDYEKGRTFLPQLILSAEAMETASRFLEKEFPTRASSSPGRKVVLATVRGDLHDIGKNIVALMLRNFGFNVLDLGKNADSRRIVETSITEGAGVIGLSALMTTSLDAMEEVVRLRDENAPGVRIILGGAAASQEFAGEIGADAYGRDAMDGVRKVQRLFDSENEN